MLNISNYVKVQSLEEAYELNQKKTNCIIGGMLWLRMSSKTIKTAIDLCDLGLDAIEETDDSFRIGAMVTLRQLELHEGLNKHFGEVFTKAVKDIVGVQFRNLATVGGSIWGRFGFSDVLTVMSALGACVELYKGGIIPIASFAKMKADRDILVRIIIPKRSVMTSYLAVRGQSTDFPSLTCAIVREARNLSIAIGARPGKAVVVEETLDSDALDEAFIASLVKKLSKDIYTGSNIRGSKEYRSHLIEALVGRGLNEVGGSCNGN